MRRSIRTRLTIIFVVLAIVPMALVGALLIWQSYMVQQRQALELQQEITKRAATEIQAFLHVVESELQALIQIADFNVSDLEAQEDALAKLMGLRRAFDELAILGPTGQETVRVSRFEIVTPDALRDRSQTDAFRIPLQKGQVYYGPVYFNTLTDEPLLEMALPIQDVRSGEIDAVVVAAVRLKPIWNVVENIPVGQGGTVSIVDATGRVVAHRDPSVVLRGTGFLSEERAGIFTGITGENVVLTTTKLPLGNQTLYLVAELPVEEALAPAFRSVLTAVTLLLITLVVATGLGVLAVRQIVRPIQQLAATAHAITDGDLSRQAAVTSEDEIGDLARSFNAMTRQLSGVLIGLEERVAARTAELENASANLLMTNALLLEAKQSAENARVMAEASQREAEEANRLKSQFLANMSHELRTPLNSILNFTGFVLDEVFGALNEQQRRYLSLALQSSEHLLGLINDILDLSKIEAGRLELFKDLVDLPELIHGVLSTAVGLIKDKPIQLRQEIAPELPLIPADRTRIRQVLLNLLSNAAKFTDRGSITVRATRQGSQLLIQVVDTGIGIAPQYLESIFEEFEQVDSATNRRYEGTGLGLAICRRLIEMHGGQIWVESMMGVGTTFAFTIPLDESPIPLPAPAPAVLASPRHDGPTVLVIDDDPAAIEIVSTHLAQDGYTVYALSDSRLALEEVRHYQPSVIVLDVMMPYKDGWELLADLKAAPDLQDIPVVLYTVLEEQRHGFYLGASGYLTKPVREDALRETIQRMVGKNALVLVIDDDPNARDIVTQMLQHFDSYRVITAPGGREGLAQVAQEPPDLIILDLMMPEVDGFAVIEHLQQDPHHSNIPVLVLTAKELTATERAFLNQRVNGLVSKSHATPAELRTHVGALLRSHLDPPPNGAHERPDAPPTA